MRPTGGGPRLCAGLGLLECMCGGSRPIGGGPAGSGGPLWNPPFGLPPRLLGRRPPFIMLPCDP